MSVRLYEGVNLNRITDKAVREALKVIDDFCRSAGQGIATAQATADSVSGGGAPASMSFLTVNNEALLSAERALAVSAPVTKSDGGANGALTLGVTLATPTIGFGTAYAAGVATSLVRSDCTIKFPTSLMSTANSATLALTDNAIDLTLTGSLGILFFSQPGGFSFQSPSAAADTINVNGVVGTNPTLIDAVWTSGALSSQTARCWDARYNISAGWTSGTIIGYDMSQFQLTPTAAGGSGNVAYGAQIRGPLFNATGAPTAFTEVGALRAIGTSRVVNSPTITTGFGAKIDMPRLGSTDQYGVWVVTNTVQGTAPTNRYGLKIDDMGTSGTNIWALHTSNRARLANPSGTGLTVLDLVQGNTGATAGAHINFDDKAGNPGSPNAGDLWRNGASLNYRKDGATTVDLAAAASGGDNISVNGTAATDADFDDATPAAPGGLGGGGGFDYVNVRWQKDALSPNNISGYIGKDKNGNPALAVLAAASAVNFFGIQNSATGVGIIIGPQGTDSNIDMTISGYGASGKIYATTPGTAGGEVITRAAFAPLAILAFAGAMA